MATVAHAHGSGKTIRTVVDMPTPVSTLAPPCRGDLMPVKILMQLMGVMFTLLRSLCTDKSNLAMEVLALRQQLAVLKRKNPRPSLTDLDRAFWASLKDHFSAWALRLRSGRADALIIVKPETVVRWHKEGFRRHWARKSARAAGRPQIPPEHIDFIKRISGDHPEYGEDRIALELELKLGIRHSTATVRKYMVKGFGPGKARSPQSWSTFLKNQASAIWTCDFCVQRTVKFTALYIFVIMELGSRRVMHINVTEHPAQEWVRQQIRTATYEKQPKFLLHDNDGMFGQLGKPVTAVVNGKNHSCRSTFDVWLAEAQGIRGIPTPYRAPNANAHIERFNGSLRRELLDHILVWNESQLRVTAAEYVRWYNSARVHQGIHGIPDPDPELAKPRPAPGRLVARPVLGGLHHDYRLAA